jgi:beta-phosphoglucomutase-like phosphatase (HAD superfamily)
MGIVTTSRRVDFELIHRERTITNYMEFVLTVEDYAKAKPDPAPYLAGLAQFNAQASEAIAVEDTSRGLRSAAAANIDCIVIATPFTKTQDFSLAKQVIGSIEELPGVLAALNEGN